MKCSMMDREMTREKMELLGKISEDADMVRSGNLCDWQIELMHQYDYAMEYLRAKYPSYCFKIINCEQKNKWNSYTTIV